ncbi:tyrosine-type recombinase/integrase [Tsukamurella paurometabola]|uniref:Tyrosine-type recombinase/integrase n=1 Tax=Tsukamurella paurometabola TaxID=2061 RepID=A0ABS5NJ44_TSUPA|nr:tyrosine-type recombinase/integrase [Tsukamurella paurometabola]MBS4104304.1 tyrosine-type recombinase/integrase [Tsukamurella paurometabola]
MWTQKTKTGRYRGLYRDADGRTRSAGTFDRKKSAELAASAAEESSRTTGGNQTYAQWWERWAANHLELGRGSATVAQYQRYYARFLEPEWGETPLKDILPADVQIWVRRLRGKQAAKKTVALALSVLSVSLRDAVLEGQIASNPCREVRVPGDEVQGDDDVKWVSRADADKLIMAMPSTEDRALLQFAFATGLRIGEIAALSWDDVDLDEGYVRVRRSWSADSREVGPTKTHKSRRVPLTDDAVRRLRARLEVDGPGEWPNVAVKYVEAPAAGLVFPGADGRPIVINTLRKRMARASMKAKLPDNVTPHMCRHSYASWLVQAGVSLVQVRDVLGHASITTTEIYAKAANSGDDAIREALS